MEIVTYIVNKSLLYVIAWHCGSVTWNFWTNSGEYLLYATPVRFLVLRKLWCYPTVKQFWR